MADERAAPVPLESGERVLRIWAVEPTLPDGSAGRSGWLVLTTRRVLFHRKAGWFGSARTESPGQFERRLEEVRSISEEHYWMKIGYGDRLAIPGLSIDGQGFRLNRELPALGVLTELEGARRARKSELDAHPT
jgi:hypothetical protein